jgi:hypothetical protein
LPVLDEMVGRDLLRDPPRPDVIGEILRSRGGVQVRRSWIRTARWSLDVSTEIDGTPASRELRDGKLVDLLADPLEHVNLYHSPAYAGVVGELEARLDERTREGRVPSPGVTN